MVANEQGGVPIKLYSRTHLSIPRLLHLSHPSHPSIASAPCILPPILHWPTLSTIFGLQLIVLASVRVESAKGNLVGRLRSFLDTHSVCYENL